MPRYRYRRNSRSRRQKQNVTWQRMRVDENISTLAQSTVTVQKAAEFAPGVGASGGYRAFDDQVVLQRIRGTWSWIADPATTDDDHVLQVVMFAFKVPAEVAQDIGDDDLPNPWDTNEGEDYFFYETGSRAGVSANPFYFPTLQIDNRSKRRFDVGDRVVLCWAAHASGGASSVSNVGMSCNLSLLWRKR